MRVLIWADVNDRTIDLLPLLTDNSIYIDFDKDKHRKNLMGLKATNYFSSEFIANYNRLILELDRRIKGGSYLVWFVGDLPPFFRG